MKELWRGQYQCWTYRVGQWQGSLMVEYLDGEDWRAVPRGDVRTAVLETALLALAEEK